MKRWNNVVWALVAVVAMAAPAFAQGGGASSTGSISGEIKDAQGGVLPGVTVTATSPAQIGALTAVTNEAGIYRFPAVPPGEYRLAYELAGFQSSVRDGIRITLGFNAQVNVTLNVATLQETVTVSGESPVIDTSATRIQTNYDQQMLSSLPNARDMWSLLATTPSVTLNRVDVGGSTAGTQTTYFAYGYSGQNRPLIEGINTTEGTSAAGFYLDYGSFEEVFIGAAANSAEMPNPGVLTQFVGKSGSNRPSVSLYYDYENEDIQSRISPPTRSCPSAGDGASRPDGNRLAELQEPQPRRRRSDGQGQDVGALRLPESAELRGGAAGRQHPRRHAVRHQAVQLHRQGHVPVEPGQQVHRLPAARHQAAAEPHRQQQSPRRAGAHHRATRRCCRIRRAGSTRASGTARSARTCSPRFRAGQFGYNFGLDSNTNDTRYEIARRPTRSSAAAATGNSAPPQPVHRRRQLLQGQVRRRLAQLQVGGEYLDEKGETLWNSDYADNVMHFVQRRRCSGPCRRSRRSTVRLTNNSDSWARWRRRACSSPTPGRSTS